MQNPDSLLIVDDDSRNRELMGRRLNKRGFQTFSVGDGNEALAWIDANPVDLVLLDVEMPGLGGMDVLKEVRKKFTAAQLPVIMVTGKADSSDIVAALDAGANDYVTKPIDFPVVLARIQTQIERKHTEDALRKSEERYALAMRAANDGLWDWDLQSGAIYFSPRWKSMVGEEEDALGDSPEEWFGRIHPDDVERVRADIQAHIDGQTPHYEDEYRVLHKDGTYLWMLGRGLAIRDKNGKAYRMAGSQTDITRGKVVDFLTGLPNRVLFMDRLSRSFERVRRRRDRTFALIFMDLDNFKLINDSLGHMVGDQLLVAIARRLESTVRSSDSVARIEHHTIARIGGDEFTVLLEDVAGPLDAIRVTDRIISDMGAPFVVDGHELFPTASIGIAVYNHSYQSPDALLQDADMAMYSAKVAGKGRYEIFDTEMRAASVARLQLETEFRRAIERNEFENYYQAIVSFKTGRIYGFEALVRWRNATRGIVPPMEFIPMAEETGLIIPLGQWVLETACRQTSQWQARFPQDPPLSISVNLSARHFLQSDVLQQCTDIMKKMPLARRSLVLEVTESTLMKDHDASIELMGKLKDFDIRIAMDDFGTGYSSLSYLHQFPFDNLKIDRSFIIRLMEDDEIVRTILTMGHNLGLKVVAEGVETLSQVDKLKEMECDYGQGYYFSKPVATREATALLEAQSGLSFIPPADALAGEAAVTADAMR
ncbi:MAG: EAL domain-containing protein [Acidobacteriota bacterium]|nr:EAL domain-containing protein [Acidobacteriota bacterium]